MKRISMMALAASAALFAASAPAQNLAVFRNAAVFQVGAAVKDITPATPQFLGGFGNGPATAVAHDPLQVRAFFVADPANASAVAFAIVDSQGWFAGYQEGPWGVTDARQAVAEALKGRYPGFTQANVIVSSTHSHAAPTIMGIWGPTDPQYLKFVFDRTVAAVLEAAANAVPAELWETAAETGAAAGQNVAETDIYDGWRVDVSTPVLWARKRGSGKTIALYANVPIHADIVNGAALGMMSSDHIGVARDALEAQLGGTAVVAMGTLGRQESIVQTKGFTEAQRVGTYATRQILDALARATPITDGIVAAAEQYILAPATNAALTVLNVAAVPSTTLGVTALDGPLCDGPAGTCPIDRSILPPFSVAGAIGTWVTSFRIGDVVYVSEFGEAFPEVTDSIQRSIAGARAVHVVGMAQDQLGYYYGPEMYPFTEVNPSDHLIFNVGPSLADENAAAAAVNAALLGFTAAPAHTAPLIEDTEAFSKPGIQFFPVIGDPTSTTVLLDAVRTTSTSDHHDDLGTSPADLGLGATRVSAITWDFGDGSPIETAGGTVQGRTQSDTVHEFPAAGDYRVTATVHDDAGRVRSWIETVTVGPCRLKPSSPGCRSAPRSPGR